MDNLHDYGDKNLDYSYKQVTHQLHMINRHLATKKEVYLCHKFIYNKRTIHCLTNPVNSID